MTDTSKICVWYEDSDGPWTSSCGTTFEINDHDTPSDVGMVYCFKCGRKLSEELAGEQDDD